MIGKPKHKKPKGKKRDSDNRTAASAHSESNNETRESNQKPTPHWHRQFSRTCLFVCYFGKSLRNPDNLPSYLIFAATVALAIFAYNAWIEATHGTDALQTQLNILRDEQRPWIEVADAIPQASLRFSDAGMPGTTIRLTITNVGKAPALNVNFVYVLTLLRTDETEKTQCKSQINFFVTLFPSRSEIEDISAGADKNELNQIKSVDGKKMIFPHVVGCVSYRINGDKTWHHSPFDFEIQHWVMRTPNDDCSHAQCLSNRIRKWIYADEQDIPATEIALAVSFNQSGFGPD